MSGEAATSELDRRAYRHGQRLSTTRALATRNQVANASAARWYVMSKSDSLRLVVARTFQANMRLMLGGLGKQGAFAPERPWRLEP